MKEQRGTVQPVLRALIPASVKRHRNREMARRRAVHQTPDSACCASPTSLPREGVVASLVPSQKPVTGSDDALIFVAGAIWTSQVGCLRFQCDIGVSGEKGALRCCLLQGVPGADTSENETCISLMGSWSYAGIIMQYTSSCWYMPLQN